MKIPKQISYRVQVYLTILILIGAYVVAGFMDEQIEKSTLDITHTGEVK